MRYGHLKYANLGQFPNRTTFFDVTVAQQLLYDVTTKYTCSGRKSTRAEQYRSTLISGTQARNFFCHCSARRCSPSSLSLQLESFRFQSDKLTTKACSFLVQVVARIEVFFQSDNATAHLFPFLLVKQMSHDTIPNNPFFNDLQPVPNGSREE